MCLSSYEVPNPGLREARALLCVGSIADYDGVELVDDRNDDDVSDMR